MAFGRKKKDEPAVEIDDDVVEAAAPPPEPEAATTGPYDAADVAEGDDTARLDLGGIRVYLAPDVEVRVDMTPEGAVQTAVAVHGNSQMMLNAFAAPRRDGIWDDVRREIAESLEAQQGASPEEADGPFGRELRARIPGGQAGQLTPARFVGVDGPRWFLRGLITGPAATNPAQATVLEDVFRQTVVVRGNDAMPPREPLPLKLPREAQEAAQQAQQQGGEPRNPYAGGEFDPFERGPEITETR